MLSVINTDTISIPCTTANWADYDDVVEYEEFLHLQRMFQHRLKALDNDKNQCALAGTAFSLGKPEPSMQHVEQNIDITLHIDTVQPLHGNIFASPVEGITFKMRLNTGTLDEKYEVHFSRASHELIPNSGTPAAIRPAIGFTARLSVLILKT